MTNEIIDPLAASPLESAAPELLAALRDVTDLAERYGAGEDCDGNILAARAAIAKAERGGGMKARFPVGLTYRDKTEKHKRDRRIVDILTTTSQATGEVVKIEYETEHDFMGQRVRGFANDTRIARSLSNEELRKYL